jgi:hypothetical protein
MKKLFYRLASTRSFAKLFSMEAQLEKRRRVIMCSSKLISALVFAAFSFCFAQAARAQCDNPDFCSDPGIPSVAEIPTGSSVSCELEPGGASQPFNKLSPDPLTTWPTTNGTATFSQSGTAICTHLPDNTDLGPCHFVLTWTGVTISACTANNSFTAGAFCTNLSLFGGGLNVTGEVTCHQSGKVLALGIDGLTQNQCNQVFPKIKQGNTTILEAGKVLDLTITTEGSTGACQGPFVAISNLKERYCSDQLSGLGVDCNPGTTTTQATTVNPSAAPFDFAVTQTVNTSPTFCKGGSPVDKGQATVSIFGSNTFDVTKIDQTNQAAQPLECEGAPLTCGTPTDLNNDGILDLPCRVFTCPNFGPNLGQLPRIAPGVVSATCTGQLNSGTQIVGIADVNVSPK